MAYEDSACVKDNPVVTSHENEWSVPQDAHKGAVGPHTTASQEPGTARVSRAKTRLNLKWSDHVFQPRHLFPASSVGEYKAKVVDCGHSYERGQKKDAAHRCVHFGGAQTR